MSKLELQSGYIADAIIETKRKRFNENFTTMEEVNIIKQVIEQRIKNKSLNVKIINAFFRDYFSIINGVITKVDEETETLKVFISGKDIQETTEICETIYDENLIYLCLCEIIISKLNNSIKHTCSTCNSFCCGGLCDEKAKTCSKWTHDFAQETNKELKKALEI